MCSHLASRGVCRSGVCASGPGQLFNVFVVAVSLLLLKSVANLSLSFGIEYSNECKRRKIKCNGETPCQRCGRQRVQCVYVEGGEKAKDDGGGEQ